MAETELSSTEGLTVWLVRLFKYFAMEKLTDMTKGFWEPQNHIHTGKKILYDSIPTIHKHTITIISLSTKAESRFS